MTDQLSVEVPPPSSVVFKGAIRHPNLWLWDSWVCQSGGGLHLYSLALNRVDAKGHAIAPSDRNLYPFHVRHFASSDHGRSWTDRGCFLAPRDSVDGSFCRNVWSGSAAVLHDRRHLFAFTGIPERGRERKFLQTLCVATGAAPSGLLHLPDQALSCPERDYDEITRLGYYLSPRENLGANGGEDGGPILAWRDPYVFVDAGNEVHLFWSAKIAPRRPAVGHAKLTETPEGFRIAAMSSPLELPDAHLLTQAEVPKVYWDEKRDLYYLLISACDRLFEGQPDREVSMVQRLYVGSSPTGPWREYSRDGSLLAGLDHLFGASLISADFDSGTFTFVAPYTQQAAGTLQLTFAPARALNIYAAPSQETEKLA